MAFVMEISSTAIAQTWTLGYASNSLLQEMGTVNSSCCRSQYCRHGWLGFQSVEFAPPCSVNRCLCYLEA